MREQVQLVLKIIREASKRGIVFPMDVNDVLLDVLEITDEEFVGICEILAADVREATANTPEYGRVNDELNGIDLSPWRKEG